MNKTFTSLASLAVVALSGYAISDTTGEPAAMKSRHMHPALVEKMESLRERKSERSVRKAPLRAAEAPGRQLYGLLNEEMAEFSDLWPYQGAAEINDDLSFTTLTPDDNQFATMSGCWYKGQIFAMDYNTDDELVTYSLIDPTTWEANYTVSYKFTADYIVGYDFTYDPATDRIYGCFVKDPANYAYEDGFESSTMLGYLNLDDIFAPVTTVGDMEVGMRGIAADAAGMLYGVGFDGVLYTIDKLTAELTEVAPIGYPEWPSSGEVDPADPMGYFFPGYESAVIDWETGTMYFSMNDSEGDSFILTIDTTDGSAEIYLDYGYFSDSVGTCDVITALYFQQDKEVVEGTPGPIYDLNVEPAGTECKAQVSFMMPDTDTDGAPLQGNIGWQISAFDNLLLSGEAAPGAEVSVTVDVEDDAYYTFEVKAFNGENFSKASTFRAFVGCDTPMISGTPASFAEGCEVTLSWKSAIASNDGNMLPVTYRVTRMPGNTVIAEACQKTHITDIVSDEEKQVYSYLITPVSGEKEGEAVATRELYAGLYFTLPHTDSFDSELLFNQYPALDANRDGNTWWVDTKRGAAVYSGNDKPAEDYLCIGPFRLTAGTLYNLRFTADGHNMTEDFAAYVGTDPKDATTFRTCIVEATEVNPSVGEAKAHGEFIPEEDGEYYFGIMAISPANTKNLYIFDVSVTGVTNDMPAAPAVTPVPTAEGIRLDIALPEMNLDGTALTDVKSLLVYRDGELLREIESPEATDSVVSYLDDSTVEKGFHTYSVTAVSEKGEGKAWLAELYCGKDIPARPTDLRVWEDASSPGLIHLTWNAPITGAHGGYINPAEVYYVADWLSYSAFGAGKGDAVTECKFDLQIPEWSLADQDVISFTVTACNAEGTSRESGVTRGTYFGPAFTLPYAESWAGSRSNTGIWYGESIEEAEEGWPSLWDVADGTLIGSTQDKDGYIWALSTNEDGGGYRTRMPRITLQGAEDPVLVFYYNHSPFANDLTLELAVEDQPYQVYREFEINEADHGKWIQVVLPLAEFKDKKYIQFAFTGHANDARNQVVAIDNVNIFDRKNEDLIVKSFSAPVKTAVNEDVELSLTVRNSSLTDLKADDFSVNLFKNGKLIATFEGVDLPALTDAVLAITDTPGVTDPEEISYQAVVVCDNDINDANNSTEELMVRVIPNDYPAPDSLVANAENGVTLTWNAPDPEKASRVATTDGFDSYDAFVTDHFGAWTTYDVDGAPTVIMATALGMLDYPNIGTPMAWQVMDPEAATILNGAWYARSGKQFLVSFQACRDGNREIESEDWLVSPELDGSAQRISFYARAGMSSYAPELMDILYSTTGKEMDDFKLIANSVDVTYEKDWKEYYYDLPEGTKYFAIVHRSYNKLALLIDDITYIPAGASLPDLKLMCYNLYRDGKRIAEIAPSAASCNDITAEEGKSYTYNITAVWNLGESPLSAPATVTAGQVSVDTVGSDKISLSCNGLEVSVNAPAGTQVSVYSVSGIPVAYGLTGDDTLRIQLPAGGAYIVNVAGKSYKLVAGH